MENQCKPDRVQETAHPLRLSSFFIVALFLAMTVLFSACTSQNPNQSTPTSQNTDQNTPTVLPSGTASSQYTVKVYFSKVNATNYDNVVAVNRTSPTPAVGTFAVEQVVAGPTPAEQNQGLFSQLHNSISGPSNCTGQNEIGESDFLLTLDKKGRVDEKGTATLKFCRDIISGGIGDDARIQVEVTTTLKQFSTIQKVVILLKSGHCLGDESGQDMCLK